MLEANVLFGVTAVVVACLVIWVGVVLKMAKQPWAREPVKSAVVVESKLVGEPKAEPAGAAKDDLEKSEPEREKDARAVVEEPPAEKALAEKPAAEKPAAEKPADEA